MMALQEARDAGGLASRLAYAPGTRHVRSSMVTRSRCEVMCPCRGKWAADAASGMCVPFVREHPIAVAHTDRFLREMRPDFLIAQYREGLDLSNMQDYCPDSSS